ncbi:MAG: NTP transferase domain-containing protein [Coriobacteriia bacterium]|nr:NTP transferase domain-containing protein [Coriobacteriia bacterium]
MKVDAAVLAGGEGAVIDPTVSIKGLVPIAGRPMIEWVVDALRAASCIGEIAVVVPTAHGLGSWAERVDHLVISDGSFIDNAIAGCGAFNNGRPVLGATGDLPALTPEAIDDYVARSLASGAEFTYPLVSAIDMEAQFPGSQRTYVKVAGGPVTGGNMMVMSADLVKRNREIGQRLFETRKSPVAMARVIGIPFVFKYATGRLRVDDVERKMEQLLGAKCAAIYTPHASIGADVDKPIDVVVAERVLYRRATGSMSPEGS